ncbi:M23 family metallopeptidase [Parafrankia sp. BMG5.11]|uniref:M23 family metallopeptidase n=2 Tax=unclassified Parafrankia TaxID=2994368 RepID=UPI00103D4F00|nr:M23 family metallopeptidase [Parafrankia sp. BMG5.11]TCJ36393.1 M23 family peptidase [Parafrankia sp. BMG5.11]
MPHPPRFDPHWLVIPALALMIALGCPGRVPIRGSFGAGAPDVLTAPATPAPPVTAAIPAAPTSPDATTSRSPADTPATTVAIPRTASSEPTAAPAVNDSPGGLTAAAPTEPTPDAPTSSPAQAPAPARARDGDQRWRWPLPEPVTVAGIFRAPTHPYGPGHRGVDLRSDPGVGVRAARPGVVGFAGWVGDRWVVTVVHGALRTTYEPVRPLVHEGQTVGGGDQLGLLEAGHPGCPGAACLHWGVLRGSEYLDPLSFFHRVPPRLLPLDG